MQNQMQTRFYNLRVYLCFEHIHDNFSSASQYGSLSLIIKELYKQWLTRHFVINELSTIRVSQI